MKKVTVNYTNISDKLFFEINSVRRKPSSYISKLEFDLQYFRGNVLYKPKEDPIKTNEGKTAYLEAIDFLKEQVSVPILELDERLSSVCKDHVEDIGPKGLATHESSNGLSTPERIEKICEWDGICCENIDFGSRTAEEVLVGFIVDDGVTSRIHRKNLFNPDIKFLGIWTGKHKLYESITDVIFVQGIRDIGEESPDIKNFIKDILLKAEEAKKNPKKKKNAFQLDDPDAPDSTTCVSTSNITKMLKGKERNCKRKVYTLEDGTKHIVEIIDDRDKK